MAAPRSRPKVRSATCAASDRLTRAAKKFRLTPREIQVLKLLATGAAWKAVADTLNISSRTVEFHARKITQKTLCPTCWAAHTMLCGFSA